MPVTVQWLDDEKKILYYDCVGQWTWNEIFASLAQGQRLLDTVDYPVASIVNLASGEYIPDNLASYMRQVASSRNSHPNDSGITVFVNAKRLVKAMLEFVEVTNPDIANIITFEQADSIDKAKRIIQTRMKNYTQ